MDVAVSGVIPDPLRFKLQSVEMGCELIVSLGMSTAVTPTTDVSADEADPKVRR